MGTFTLTRFNGIEKFKIESATIHANFENELIFCWITVSTSEDAIQRNKDTEEMGGNPNAEICLVIKDINELKDHLFSVQNAFDESLEQHLATIYYYEHDDLNKNLVHVKHINDDLYHIHWTAECIDCNYYDGSKPPTIVEISGEFIFENQHDFNK